MMNLRVLVLNGDYSPYDIVTWKRAMTLTLNNPPKAKTIEEYNCCVRDGRGNIYPIPSIVVLSRYCHVKAKRLGFSKFNVYLRDGYTCQYCGKVLPKWELTIDHVIPRKYFQKNAAVTTYSNVVTACKRCNNIKGARTPELAKMKLLNGYPKNITRSDVLRLKAIYCNPPKEWMDYFH